jgi:guanine deaminase
LVLESHDPTAHAEIVAIRNASKKLKTHDLSECILYATGYPCPMCLSAIIWANIKEVYYATDLKDAEEIGFRDDYIYDYIKGKNNEIITIKQIGRNQAIKLFEEYEEKSKTIY